MPIVLIDRASYGLGLGQISASSYRACKSRGETMRDFRLPEPFDYRSDILTLKSLFRKSSLCLRTP